MGIVFKNTKQPNNQKKGKREDQLGKSDMNSAVNFPADVKKYIHQIQLLVGVTQADFRLLYTNVIEKIIYLYEPFCHEILNIAINALKKRRGYLLPVGADSEVSFREHEAWTYAVFSAAVLKTLLAYIPDQAFDELKNILPSQGLLWLEWHVLLIQEWNNYLINGQDTIFSELIGFISAENLGTAVLINNGDYDGIINNT